MSTTKTPKVSVFSEWRAMHVRAAALVKSSTSAPSWTSMGTCGPPRAPRDVLYTRAWLRARAMLDLHCSCSDNFATIEHLSLISLVSGGLYVLMLFCAIYLQYAMFETNARCAYAPVALGVTVLSEGKSAGSGAWGCWREDGWQGGAALRAEDTRTATWQHQRAD